jgi:chaperonin GroEL
LALIQVVAGLEKIDVSDWDEEAKIGFTIAKRAMEEPIRQIATNAGLDGAIIADKAKHEKKGIGYDASAMEWKDMIKAGIIDPAKVTRSALQNAASISGLLLTTECAVTDLPEKEEPMAGGGPGMGGMPMM